MAAATEMLFAELDCRDAARTLRNDEGPGAKGWRFVDADVDADGLCCEEDEDAPKT